MAFISSYGTSDWMVEDRIFNFHRNGANVTRNFKYPEVVHSYFQSKDSGGYKNPRRVDPISLVEIWKTTRWKIGLLNLLLSVTKFNSFLSLTKL